MVMLSFPSLRAWYIGSCVKILFSCNVGPDFTSPRQIRAMVPPEGEVEGLCEMSLLLFPVCHRN